MSRGLSKRQRIILAVLDGSRPRRVYAPGPMTTRELVQELVAHGALPERAGKPAWRQALFTTRRACFSLVRRGLLEGRYCIDGDPPSCLSITWKAVTADANKSE